MTIWLDAQLSPEIGKWMREQLGVDAIAVRDIGLRDASDWEIFSTARQFGAVVMTKDNDFVHLVNLHGAPPQVLWLTCGNTSNARLRQILGKTLDDALKLLTSGEKVVEIRDIS